MEKRKTRTAAAQLVAERTRDCVSRNEVIDLQSFMDAFKIKDRRTALKVLRSLGLPVEPIAGIVLVSGEAFCQAVQNRGANHA